MDNNVSRNMMKRSYITRKTASGTLKSSKPMRKKAKAKSEGWWRNRADDLMQDVELNMYDNCTVCGGNNEVGHHFHTKQTSSFLRYDWRNIIPLCNSCHFKHHRMFDPHIVSTIIFKKGQKWADKLELDRRKPTKTGTLFYQNKCNEFEQELKNLLK